MNLGIILLELDTGLIKSFDEINSRLEARNITMILFDPLESNNVWIGTYGKGLYNWKKDSNSLYHFTKEVGILGDNWILCGVRVESGLYFGTFGGGVNHFNEESGQWQSIGLRQGLSSLDISAVTYSSPFIYFGTLGSGISILYAANDRF